MTQPPKGLQDYIYALEEGAGRGFLRNVLLLLLAIFLGVLYHLTEFRNFTTEEAMDSAQLARNIARGEGFTTDYIRPISLHVLQKKLRAEKLDENGAYKVPHPDLANGPVYPAFLAAWMKVLPFRYTIPDSREVPVFQRYQPDVLIAYINLGLFVALLAVVWSLARSLFDASVAKVTIAILFGSEILWRFTYSGLSTNLLLLLLAAVFATLIRIERSANSTPPEASVAHDPHEAELPSTDAPQAPAPKLTLWAALAGALTAVCFLTRYSTGILIIPVVGFLFFWGGPTRFRLALVALVAFAAVSSPWLVRNYQISGRPLGIADLSLYADSTAFEGHRLERSQNPDLGKIDFMDLVRKLFTNATDLFTDEIPKLAGGYTTAFFIVGLMLPFNNRALQRARWLTVATLVLFVIASSLSRTHRSTDSPTVNSENLLILLAPMVVLFGVSLFFILLDRMEFLLPQLRSLLAITFVAALSLPLLLRLAPPRTPPVAFPPYDPPRIQQFAGYLERSEWLMSDMPWAVAWYGQRRCVWNSLRVQQSRDEIKQSGAEDFFNIYDRQPAIRALYLSPITADAQWRTRFLNVGDPDTAWNRFYMQSLLQAQIPPGFPLKHALGAGYMSAGHFFLSDRARWGDYSLRPSPRQRPEQ